VEQHLWVSTHRSAVFAAVSFVHLQRPQTRFCAYRNASTGKHPANKHNKINPNAKTGGIKTAPKMLMRRPKKYQQRCFDPSLTSLGFVVVLEQQTDDCDGVVNALLLHNVLAVPCCTFQHILYMPVMDQQRACLGSGQQQQHATHRPE
jgi:hypothetical protein